MLRMLLAISLVSGIATAQETTITDDELSAVVAATQIQHSRQPHLRVTGIIGAERTAGGDRCAARLGFLEHSRSELTGDELDEALADLQRRNQRRVELREPVASTFRPADVSRFETPGGFDWPSVASAHPWANGVFEVCRPGFSSSGEYAIVRTSFFFGEHGKRMDWIFLLKKDAGAWKMLKAGGD